MADPDYEPDEEPDDKPDAPDIDDDDLDDDICSIKSSSWTTPTKDTISSKKKNKKQRTRFALSLKRFKKTNKGKSNNNDVADAFGDNDAVSASLMSAHTL